MKTKSQVYSHSGTKVSRRFCKKIMSLSEIKMKSPIGFCKAPKSKAIPGND
jgi:hypothetical protein